MSVEACKKAASKDAPKMSTDVKKYVTDNELSYYILINTWLLLIKEMAGHAWTFVAELISRDGLIPVIAQFQKEAQAVVSGEETGEVVRLMQAHLRFTPNGSFFDETNISRDTTAALLFLLRYPKRFSPNGNNRIKEETLQDFVATENRTRQLSLREYSPYVIARVKAQVYSMYDWDRICDKIEKIQDTDAMFSNGAGQDSGPSLGSKLLAIAKGNHAITYFMRPFGSVVVPIPATQRERFHYAEVMAVPKSYKASRIIAPEDTYRQAIAKRVEYIFRDEDRRLNYQTICLEDQGINQELAWLGSKNGAYATLDASHASDMISKVLFRELFPPRFVSLIEPLLDTYVKVKGKLRLMQMLSTSGHSLTFRLETIVYKSIALAAAEWVDTLSLERGAAPRAFAWAYGDDVIINSEAAETATEWYSALGLKINESKSFWSKDHLYRESCGKEYYQGIDVSTVSFPRFPIVGSLTPKVILSKKAVNDEYRGKIDSSLTMLISLEKKLFPYSKDAAYLVLDILKAADRKMTTSLPGSDSTDPWGYIDTGRPVSLRAYKIVRTPKPGTWEERVPGKGSPSFESIPLPYDQAGCQELERLANLDKFHTCPVVRYTEPKGTGDEDLQRRIYDLYRYQNFLQHGPKYESPLDELLGVSSKPMSYAEFYGKKTLEMAFIR